MPQCYPPTAFGLYSQGVYQRCVQKSTPVRRCDVAAADHIDELREKIVKAAEEYVAEVNGAVAKLTETLSNF